jgi:hypothetical protein
MKDYLRVLFACLCISFNVSGQVVLENNPTSLKWQQVNTQNFRYYFQKDLINRHNV